MACCWVPHDHHLGHVAKLAEVLLQTLLRGLPGEAADEHLSGDGKPSLFIQTGSPPLVNPIPSGFMMRLLQTSLTMQDFLPWVIRVATVR